MENVWENSMSDWSGNLYFFYSEIDIDIFFSKLINIFQNKFNYCCQHNNYLNEKAMLFYHDNEMLNLHYEQGFNLNKHDLGCIGVEAKKVSTNAIAKLHTFDGLDNFDPYNVYLAFKEINYYTLVLPDIPENSKFCFS